VAKLSGRQRKFVHLIVAGRREIEKGPGTKNDPGNSNQDPYSSFHHLSKHQQIINLSVD
jgi:hypothetical protein